VLSGGATNTNFYSLWFDPIKNADLALNNNHSLTLIVIMMQLKWEKNAIYFKDQPLKSLTMGSVALSA
jgi:hypothetical protein